ncbi:two-component system sensor histidine kinase YcbA [Clostridiales Family XIII bacterium PM5-7]
MKKWKRAFLMAGCVSISAQIYVNLFIDGFIITMAVIVLGLFMYQYNTLHPILSGMLVGLASPLFRGIILFMRSNLTDLYDRLQMAFHWVYPDIGFYCTYGLVFFVFYQIVRKRKPGNYFFCMLCCDFLSNMVEMLLRNGGLAPMTEIKTLFFIAIGRATVVWFAIICMEAYRSLLAEEEHEERYKKLLIMASVFKSEVYFMNKNMVEIEDVMKKSFELYRTMDNEDYPEPMREITLDIAKDIHEIKKDYIRVIQGLQENFLADLYEGQMWMKEIVSILHQDIQEQIKEEHRDIQFYTTVRENLQISDHFSMMSVLRNLALNSLDSIGGKRNGEIHLVVDVDRDMGPEEAYIITVRDNGGGIKEEDIDIIFDPGFSTKFDDTGDINRGVGLTLVRDLVREKFHGDITVDSVDGEYATFCVRIPKHSLGGESQK